MKIDFWNNESPLKPLRWFIIIVLALSIWLAYADYTGWRIFSFGGQKQWNASGPGGHK
jgi:hypothetical protein